MVKTIPALDWNIGFPQKQRISISTSGILKAYDFLWRWNSTNLICEITRVEDSATMWRGVVQKLNPVEVRDPVLFDTQFTFMARELDKNLELLEVWVFEE